MNRRFRLLSAIVIAVLLLTVPSLAPTSSSAQVGPSTLGYDCNKLDYGIYWFDAGRDSQKFVSGEANPYFDPRKPTV